MFAAIPWYVFVLFLAGVGLPLAYMWVHATRAERLLSRAGLLHVRKMAWPEFLRYLEALYSGLGYQVERPPSREDYGADLILRDGTGRRTAVNARHFKEKVTPEALQEVADGAEYYGCQDTLVVGALGFVNKTIDGSEETGTILWDMDDLADAMDKVRSRPASFKPREQSLQAPVAAARELPRPVQEEPQGPHGPACPICRKPMEAKVAAGRDIWLCSRFPRCNGARMRGENSLEQ